MFVYGLADHLSFVEEDLADGTVDVALLNSVCIHAVEPSSDSLYDKKLFPSLKERVAVESTRVLKSIPSLKTNIPSAMYYSSSTTSVSNAGSLKRPAATTLNLPLKLSKPSPDESRRINIQPINTSDSVSVPASLKSISSLTSNAKTKPFKASDALSSLKTKTSTPFSASVALSSLKVTSATKQIESNTMNSTLVSQQTSSLLLKSLSPATPKTQLPLASLKKPSVSTITLAQLAAHQTQKLSIPEPSTSLEQPKATLNAMSIDPRPIIPSNPSHLIASPSSFADILLTSYTSNNKLDININILDPCIILDPSHLNDATKMDVDDHIELSLRPFAFDRPSPDDIAKNARKKPPTGSKASGDLNSHS